MIFVEFAVFELSLSLFSKCDDDKTHEDVHHEEGNDDDVDDEKDGDFYSVVVNGSSVYGVGIHSPIQEPLYKEHKHASLKNAKLKFITIRYDNK